MSMVNEVTITVNEEFVSGEFWYYVRYRKDTPPEIRNLLVGVPSKVSPRKAHQLKEWCEDTRGWGVGAEQGVFPVTFTPDVGLRIFKVQFKAPLEVYASSEQEACELVADDFTYFDMQPEDFVVV